MAEQNKPGQKPAPKKKASDEFREEEIFQAPAITREPVSRQVKLGGKVVIRVTATGKPLPSYQWFHNGKKIVGATTDRLTLSKLRRQAAGAYHCEVKNFVGKASSRPCMLSFFTQRVPRLVIGPESSRIEEGKEFCLKLVSPGSKEMEGFEIFWVFNGMRIKGARGPELRISGAKKKYEGEYKAMIAAGVGLELSNPARLVVVPAKAVAPVEPQAPAGEAGTLDEILAREVTKPIEPAQGADPWEENLFNPEEDSAAEEEGAGSAGGALQPAPAGTENTQGLGNTSPGRALSPTKAPISQMATADLIREVAAQGGASELLEEIDPSGLICAEPALSIGEDPSQLITGLICPPAPPEAQEEPAVENSETGPEAVIADWEETAAPAAAPEDLSAHRRRAALRKRQALLEALLRGFGSLRKGKRARIGA